MRPAVRKGDLTYGHPPHGKLELTVCNGNVLGNGKQIGILGDIATSASPHDGTVVTASTSVSINNKGVVRKDDLTACGDSFETASPNIFVGD